MYRIDNSTASVSLPTPAAVGPKPDGYFTKGSPIDAIPATIVDDDWANSIQEELMSVLTAGGVTPSKTEYNQLLLAIQAIVPASIPDASTTVKGKVELATDAETITGADTTRAVVPSALLAEQKAHPAFSANRNNVNQTAVASGVATKIILTTELFDNSAAFDTTLSRFTPLMAGIYDVKFACRLNNATDLSAWTVFIYKNGTQFRSSTFIQSGAAGTQSGVVSDHVDMNGTTDYLEFFVTQDTGSARDVLGATLQTFASAALVVRR